MLFYKSEPKCMLNIFVLDDLSTFKYVELINDILENCILYVQLGILSIEFGVLEIGVVVCF
jgi:hypothetical protein